MRRGLLLSSLSALLACACAGGAEQEGDDDGALTTERAQSRNAFFENELLYVRIRDWDNALMTPASLADERVVRGAEMSVFAADKTSKVHCPDDTKPEALLYSTKDFSLRTSGNMTNGTPKSSYKIGLEKKNDRLFGMSALNLKSMWNDVSNMREALAWRIFGEAKVPAPKHTYAKLCINGRYYGLYSVIEQVDKSFLKDRFGENDDGNLYKAYWPDHDIGPATLEYRRDSSGDDSGRQYRKHSDIEQRTYRLKTNDGDDDPAELKSYDDLATFVRTVHHGGSAYDTPEYATQMESVLDVKTFLRWAAVNSLLGAWDNYWATPANYYLYNAGKAGDAKGFMRTPYFVWIPWDYDNTFGIDFHSARWQSASIVDWPSATRPYYRGSSVAKLPLVEHLFANQKFLRYYLDTIERLNDTVFNEAWVTRQIGDERSGLRSRVQSAAYLEADSPGGAAHTGRQWTNDEVFRNGFSHDEAYKNGAKIDGILHYVRMRHDAVASQLRELRRAHPRGSGNL